MANKDTKLRLVNARDDDDEIEENEFDDLELLERLESLREDMEDLGVTSLAEVMQRIDELHQQLDKK